jgi:hypothetical protein
MRARRLRSQPAAAAGRPRFWRSFSGCRHPAGCAPEARAPRASPLPAAGFLASPCISSLALGFRTPRLPLLPVWEKGVGGMRGKRAPQRSGRHCGTTAFLALLLWLQASRRVRAGGARTQGISASSGRFFGKPLHFFSRFGLQDLPTPPSPRVGEGGRGMRGKVSRNEPARADGLRLAEPRASARRLVR